MNGVHSPPSHCIPKKKKGAKQNLKLGTLPDTDVWHKIIHKSSRSKKKKKTKKDICEKC
jgi:hypothetical protein